MVSTPRTTIALSRELVESLARLAPWAPLTIETVDEDPDALIVRGSTGAWVVGPDGRTGHYSAAARAQLGLPPIPNWPVDHEEGE